MAIHLIPDTESDLHEMSEDCPCEPEFKLDDESCEMVWVHNIINFEKLFEDFVEI